jgi:hypothetical protein
MLSTVSPFIKGQRRPLIDTEELGEEDVWVDFVENRVPILPTHPQILSRATMTDDKPNL